MVEPRAATYDEDEIQPGDIDYEFTMMLMRCCPCLRPPPHPLDDFDSDDEDDYFSESDDAGAKAKAKDPKQLRSLMSHQDMDLPGGGGSAWEVVHGADGDYWWNKVSGETTWEDPTKGKTRNRGATTVSVV